MKALVLLDKILAEEGMQEKLGDSIRKAFAKNPLGFFYKFVMPLLPRDMVIRAGGEDGAVRWVSLLTTIREREGADAAPAGPPVIDAECRDVPPRQDKPAAVESEQEPGRAAD